MARAAERLGAGWVILQPPPVAGLPEIEYVRFLGAVADQVSAARSRSRTRRDISA